MVSSDDHRVPGWAANRRDPAWVATPPDPRAADFHRGLPDYTATPLVELPSLARELGVGRVLVKDETERLGLPAFKALGASWAVHRAAGATEEALTVVTATDGNHGRAVARFAQRLGHQATVFVPGGVHPDAVAAIRAEGAEVVAVAGSYDDAVAAAAGRAESPGHVLVQDTAWEGYAEVPAWIVDGYGTLFAEIDTQLGGEPADLVAVPTGVGSLLQAALAHFRRGDVGPAVVSVEPHNAACVYASVTAERMVRVDTGYTSMAGLNCGTVSASAWPAIRAGLDAALITNDDDAARARADLATLGIDAGPCGAAPLAALRAVLGGDDAAEFRRHVGLAADSTVVLLVTEGIAANPSTGA